MVDRFADYVVSTANAGIVWGTNAVPFAEMSTTNFAGTTGGKAISITGTNLSGPNIIRSSVATVLAAETALYTNIRKLRAILFVNGGGGNTGSRPAAGTIYDDTQVAHLTTGYRQSITATSPASGNVTTAGLESFYAALRSDYNTKRNVTQTIQINVCHASCHSSCHGSRGRR